MKKTLIAALLLSLVFTAACGSPSKNQTTTTNLPNMAGSWNGAMQLTLLNSDLTLVVSQDGAGNLSGISSASNGCLFDIAVSGAIQSSGAVNLVSSDNGQTITLTGTLSGNSLSGKAWLNSPGTHCDGETGSFSVHR